MPIIMTVTMTNIDNKYDINVDSINDNNNGNIYNSKDIIND